MLTPSVGHRKNGNRDALVGANTTFSVVLATMITVIRVFGRRLFSRYRF